MEQGCTEQEALAAAEKVAELLDRYGLSLSELDFKEQACEGASIETERRRAGPVDDCVPAVEGLLRLPSLGREERLGPTSVRVLRVTSRRGSCALSL